MSLLKAREHKQNVYNLWERLQKEMRMWEQNLPTSYRFEKSQISQNIDAISRVMKDQSDICEIMCNTKNK